MDLYLASGLRDRYEGAFSLIFDGINNTAGTVRFMYSLDAQGFRIEHVPEANIDTVTVLRRSASPMVLFFYKSDRLTGSSSLSDLPPASPPGF